MSKRVYSFTPTVHPSKRSKSNADSSIFLQLPEKQPNDVTNMSLVESVSKDKDNVTIYPISRKVLFSCTSCNLDCNTTKIYEDHVTTLHENKAKSLGNDDARENSDRRHP